MKIVSFKTSGGPIIAEIICGEAQTGSYTLMLWEANVNQIVMEKKGNFINPDDDSYELPTPNSENNERILDCLCIIAIVPPIKKYYVELKVSQDNQFLGSEKASGESDSSTVAVELFIQLQAG